MWHDIFNAALGLGCLAIGGLTVRFLGTIDALDKAQAAQQKELANIREAYGREIRDVRADCGHIRGHLNLPPYPYHGD